MNEFISLCLQCAESAGCLGGSLPLSALIFLTVTFNTNTVTDGGSFFASFDQKEFYEKAESQ